VSLVLQFGFTLLSDVTAKSLNQQYFLADTNTSSLVPGVHWSLPGRVPMTNREEWQARGKGLARRFSKFVPTCL
jgi:hypothetical protein